MTRFLTRCVVAVSVVAAAGCATVGSDDQVKFTTNPALVSNCQEVGEITVSSFTRDADIVASLDQAARAKGANFVLLKTDGARSGVAYRCAMPNASPTASGS
jgi:azurin